MKRFLLAITLGCVLSVSALAGEIPMVGNVPAPPDPSQITSTSPGDIPISGSGEQISDAAWSALLTVLGFLPV
jgi:hypothetical protein